MTDALSFTTSITLVSGLLFLTTGLFYAVVSWACKRSVKHPEPGKAELYACGEELPASKAYIMSEQMFSGFWKGTFKNAYSALKQMHSGILDDWLSWALVIMTILTILLLLVLR
jgi:hypothetical protein